MGYWKERWERILLAVIIVGLLLANLWILGQELGLSLTPRPKPLIQTMTEEIWRERLKGDPPLGTEIETLKRFQGRRLVIVVERCTDCVAGNLKAWEETVRVAGLPKLVLVTGDREEQAKQVLDRWQIDAELVTDLKGEIAKKLHAFFTPRAYALEGGRLIWKQERFGCKPQEMVREVMRR